MRLIQLSGEKGRRVGIVDGGQIRLLRLQESIYALAWSALSAAIPLAEVAARDLGDQSLDYEAIYNGGTGWKILPAADHPDEQARCMVSGTGLSHIRSAANRQAMHAAGETVTDSMRMYE